MDKFIERAINEHKELRARIIKLDKFIADVAVKDPNISKVEYGIMFNQLGDMKSYFSNLTTRLNLHGVYFDSENNVYFEKIDESK